MIKISFMIKIRLTRRGAKNAPFYRIVAIDERKKRSGEALETIGTWKPLVDDLDLDKKKYLNWIEKGAQPTVAVKKLLEKK